MDWATSSLAELSYKLVTFPTPRTVEMGYLYLPYLYSIQKHSKAKSINCEF